MSANPSIGLNLQSGQFVANGEIEVERAMGIEPTSNDSRAIDTTQQQALAELFTEGYAQRLAQKMP
ncbi:MAG: hypothetical protein JF596_01560 [Stenotrophomonas sp.]|nr:hypothetical protein [Stenotrophomonas sp.]